MGKLGNNEPQRQHYIPKEVLLQNFCDAQGYIWVNDGSKVYGTNPVNAFVIGNLYTKSDFTNAQRGADAEAFFDSVEKSYEYEERLGVIESEATSAIRQVIEEARKGRCPRLSLENRNALKSFIFTIARRTPESQARYVESLSIEDPFYYAAKHIADRDGYPLPDKDLLYEDPDVLRFKDMVMSNVNAKFAAGDHLNVEQETQKFLRGTGLCVAVIRIPDRGFIIGSHGLTIIDRRYSRNLGAVSWLPIAPDVAVGVTTFPDREFLVTLDSTNDGGNLISVLNITTAARSERIAGASEELVRSLKPRQRKKLEAPKTASTELLKHGT